MPEGDTIHRAANTLQKALGGRTVTRFETVLPPLARVDDETPLVGRTVETVSALGKHLLIEFSGALVLRSHLRMNGSWHLYRPGEKWRKRRVDMRVVIATDEWVAVGFNLPVAEFLAGGEAARSDELRRLGPDLLGETFDLDEALRRMRFRGGEEIADVLLHQSVAAGIGNIYKSEVLYVRGVDPFAKVDALTDEQLASLLRTARRLLQHNVRRESGARDTRGGTGGEASLWVYGRRGQPCRRCGTRIRMEKQGPDARVTFWCPRCQK